MGAVAEFGPWGVVAGLVTVSDLSLFVFTKGLQENIVTPPVRNR